MFNKWVWPLYDKYGHPYDAFKLFASNEEDIYAGFDIPADIKEGLRKIVAHQLAVQPVKVQPPLQKADVFRLVPMLMLLPSLGVLE